MIARADSKANMCGGSRGSETASAPSRVDNVWLRIAAGRSAGRSEVLRDVESYAIASCLSFQPNPYLKDQGDAWASVVIQRMKGSPAALADLAEHVKVETARGDVPIIRDETGMGPDKPLPLLFCVEIIDHPAVRSGIEQAVRALGPLYPD